MLVVVVAEDLARLDGACSHHQEVQVVVEPSSFRKRCCQFQRDYCFRPNRAVVAVAVEEGQRTDEEDAAVAVGTVDDGDDDGWTVVVVNAGLPNCTH